MENDAFDEAERRLDRIAQHHGARRRAVPGDVGVTLHCYGRVFDGGRLHLLLAAGHVRLLLEQPCALPIVAEGSLLTVTSQLLLTVVPRDKLR